MEIKNINMSGKTCLITGANSGVGKMTALGLAKMGAHVIMACRNKEKGEIARLDIINNSGNKAVDLLIVDLSSHQSIHNLAKEFTQKYDQLHVLINNAGSIYFKRYESEDGLELTFAINHMGYFLLTYLLLDIIKSSAPARVINVSSTAHKRAKLDFDDLQNKKNFRGRKVYGQSKLANILFTYELADKLKDTEIAVNCLHPGFVATNLAKNNGILFKIGMKFLRPIQISPKKGAETSIYLASSPDVNGITGKYFIEKKEISSSKESYNAEARKKLWEISLNLLNLS
jgi:NAD(P)-dependent dehydrogenase (short-subunit alcohol dehydrogenase family)